MGQVSGWEVGLYFGLKDCAAEDSVSISNQVFWPNLLLSAKERQTTFVKRETKSENRELFTSEYSGNVKCRQLFAFPACGMQKLLFHVVWSSLISILLIIFQLATKVLDQETCHSASGDCRSPYPGVDGTLFVLILSCCKNVIFVFLAIHYLAATLSSVLKTLLCKMGICEAEDI